MKDLFYLLTIMLASLGYILLILFPLSKGAPYVPTTERTIFSLLEILNKYGISNFKKAVDLGSGDGRIIIALSNAGIPCDGIEQNNILCSLSKKKLKDLNLLDKSKVLNTNFLKHNLSDYDLVILFQIPYIMKKLKNKFIKELKPNTLICSYSFKIPGLKKDLSRNNWHIYKI